VGQFRVNPGALKTPFCSSVRSKRQQILVAQMSRELVEIRLQRDGLRDAEIEGFGASFIREFGKVRLRSVGDEKSAPPMPGIRRVDCPNVDILLLRAADVDIPRSGMSKVSRAKSKISTFGQSTRRMPGIGGRGFSSPTERNRTLPNSRMKLAPNPSISASRSPSR